MSDQLKQLQKNTGAAKALEVSKTFLYKLPPGTPGVYRFGRAVRYDVEELRAWASAQAKAEGTNGQV
jgi:hypothetical protein